MSVTKFVEDTTINILEDLLDENSLLLEADVETITKYVAQYMSIFSTTGYNVIERTVKAWLWDYAEPPKITYKEIPLFESTLMACCSTSWTPLPQYFNGQDWVNSCEP